MTSLKQTAARKRLEQTAIGYANGGMIRGPGTGTSDSIKDKMRPGSFIMPAEATQSLGAKALRSLGKQKVPVRVSNGEYEFTPEQVHAAGVQALSALKDQAQGFASGGQVRDPNRPDIPVVGTRGPVLGGGGGGLSREAVAQAMQPQAQQPAKYGVGALPANPVTNPGAIIADRERKAQGFASGGQVRGFKPEPQRLYGGGGVLTKEDQALSALRRARDAQPVGSPNIAAIDQSIAQRNQSIGGARSALSAVAAPFQKPLPQVAANPTDMRLAAGTQTTPIGGLAAPSEPAPAPAPAGQPGYGPIGDRTTLTNEQAAIMNPAGRITVGKSPNGSMSFSGMDVHGQVSYNDKTGAPLPGGGLRNRGFSNFDVAPAGANIATGPNGSYAFSTSGSGAQGGAQGVGAAPLGTSGIGAAQTSTPIQSSERGMDILRQMAASGQADSVGRLMASGQIQAPGAGPSFIMQSNTGFRRDPRLVAPEDAARRTLRYAQGDDPASRERKAKFQTAQLEQQGLAQRNQATNDIAQKELALKTEAHGFTTRAAQQMEQLRNVLLDPKATPEQRSQAQQTLLALSGGQSGEWGVQVTPATKNVDGSTTAGSIVKYNKRTGETATVGDTGQGAATQAPLANPSTRPVGTVSTVNGKSATWDGKQWVPRA